MAWQQPSYMISLIAAAAILFTSGLYAFWKRGHVSASKTGALLLLAGAEWMLGHALELGSSNLTAALFWSKVQYVGIAIVPTAWFVYTLQYTGREKWLTRRTLALLSIVPLITLLLAFTNEAHGLMWSRVALVTEGRSLKLDKTWGVGFWAFLGYSYILLLLATFLLIHILIRSRRLYLWQASILLFAALVPWLGSALDVFGLNPFPQFDPTVLALTVTGPIVAWSLYRLRSRDIMPVAHKTVIEGIGDGIVVLDAQNRVVQLNPVAQHLIGQAASEAIGQPVEQVWPEWPSGMELPRDGAAVGREVVMGKGDEQRTYDMRISPLLDWRGHLVSQVVVLRDITERKRAEEEVRESEEKYRTLVEDAPLGVYYSDFNGTFLYGNKKAEEIVGYKREELIGKSYLKLNLLDPKGLGKAIKLLAQNMLGRATGPDEFILNRKDGSKRTVEICTKMIPISGKQIVLGMVEDITERKRAEEALRESEERYRFLIEKQGEGISIVDPDERFTFCNPVAEEIFGVPPGKLVGRSLQEFMSPEMFEAIRKQTESCRAGERSSYELDIIRPDGEKRHLFVTSSPWLDDDGRFVGAFGIFRDETERKWAEEEVRRRSEELTTLLEATKAVSSTLDLEEVLALIAEQMVKATGVDGCILSRWDQEADAVVTSIEWRRRSLERSDEPGNVYALDDFPATRAVLETRQPLVVCVSDPDADPAEVAYMRKMESESVLMLPLVVGDQVVGLVELDQSEYERDFTAAEIRLCQALADQAAIAIENARLHAETERRLQEQVALREAGAAISSALDLKTVLSRIAEQMGRAIDATSAYIISYEPETMVACVWAEYFGPQACVQEQVSDLGVPYVEKDIEFLEIMQAGQHDTSHIDDPHLFESERAHMQQYGAKTILYIPLRIKGQLIGYTELWESRQRREFTSKEIALCQGIAQQAAIAIENARLYEQAQQEITERVRAEERIRASLKEKEVLLKEIHHRVKNNLQVISSLLYLRAKDIKDEEALEMFQDSQNRVRSMALVHERLYQSPDLARIDFAEYARNLTSYLFRSYGVHSNVIQLKVNVDDVFLSIDTAVPCGLILNELVSNSLKHAFPDGREGEIRIELGSDDDNRFTLMFGDNGVGFPEDLDFRNTESLGLQLVNNLVHQLEGTIELGRSGGTAFKITFAELT